MSARRVRFDTARANDNDPPTLDSLCDIQADVPVDREVSTGYTPYSAKSLLLQLIDDEIANGIPSPDQAMFMDRAYASDKYCSKMETDVPEETLANPPLLPVACYSCRKTIGHLGEQWTRLRRSHGDAVAFRMMGIVRGCCKVAISRFIDPSADRLAYDMVNAHKDPNFSISPVTEHGKRCVSKITAS